MTALDFPSSPTNGQIYDKWTYDGTKWVLTPPLVTGNRIMAYAEIPTLFNFSAPTAISALDVSWTADPTHTYAITLCVNKISVASGTGRCYMQITPNKQTLFFPYIETTSGGGGTSGFTREIRTGLSGVQTRGVSVTNMTPSGSVVFTIGSLPPSQTTYLMVEDIT